MSEQPPTRFEIRESDGRKAPWRRCDDQAVALAMARDRAGREARAMVVTDTETGRQIRIQPDGTEEDLLADLGEQAEKKKGE